MRPGGKPWTIGAALALGVGGCGGGDAAPDAATHDAGEWADAAGAADAGEQADAGPVGTIEVTVHDGLARPAPGIDVLLHDGDGLVVDRAVTDAAGRVEFTSAGGMITAMYPASEFLSPMTLAWVPPDTSVIIGPTVNSYTIVDTATVTGPGPYEGATSYSLRLAWCTGATLPLEPFDWDVPDCALGEDGVFRVLAIARGPAGLLASSLVSAESVPAEIELPPWSDEIETIPLAWSSVPPGMLVETSYAFSSAGVELYEGEIEGTGDLVRPGPVDGGLSLTAILYGAQGAGLYGRKQSGVPAEVTDDIVALLPDRVASVSASGAATARPTITWSFDGDDPPTTCSVGHFYTWLLLVDAAAGSVRFPEIPADLPQPSPLFDGELEVYCFRGTHLEGHLRPLDLDELPLGEVEYGGWLTYHDLL
jgi:hypothetical protein